MFYVKLYEKVIDNILLLKVLQIRHCFSGFKNRLLPFLGHENAKKIFIAHRNKYFLIYNCNIETI